VRVRLVLSPPAPPQGGVRGEAFPSGGVRRLSVQIRAGAGTCEYAGDYCVFFRRPDMHQGPLCRLFGRQLVHTEDGHLRPSECLEAEEPPAGG
jgi:hypothetical protein